MKKAFADHARRWREFRYVYPVIARRSRGLSIGINLCPDATCNYNCVYCSVDRSRPVATTGVDLPALEHELSTIVANRDELLAEPEFRSVPPEYQRLNDLAFSGDGEPTASPVFHAAARIAVDVRRRFTLADVKIVVITNGTCLTRPAVVDTLALLDHNGGEVWAKLDAGTEDYHRRVSRSAFPLQRIVENILVTARARPIVVQSMFFRWDGRQPSAEEIAAYAGRLAWLVEEGAQVTCVQVYTVARTPAVGGVEPLSADCLERIADAVRALGLRAHIFP